MIQELNRKDITSIIDDVIKDKHNKIILTGLDRCGKSTIIQNYYANHYVFKSPEIMERWYFNDSMEGVRDLVDSYQIYDRHPVLDHPAYNGAHFKWSTEKMLQVADRYLHRLKSYSTVICFLNDIYRDKSLDLATDKFEISYRDNVRQNYIALMSHIDEYLKSRITLFNVND